MEESAVMIHVVSLQDVLKVVIVKGFNMGWVAICMNSVILDLLAF
jgi:hypothetical protein